MKSLTFLNIQLKIKSFQALLFYVNRKQQLRNKYFLISSNRINDKVELVFNALKQNKNDSIKERTNALKAFALKRNVQLAKVFGAFKIYRQR